MLQILNVEFSTSMLPTKKNFIKKYDKKIIFYNLSTSESGNAAMPWTPPHVQCCTVTLIVKLCDATRKCKRVIEHVKKMITNQEGQIMLLDKIYNTKRNNNQLTTKFAKKNKISNI